MIRDARLKDIPALVVLGNKFLDYYPFELTTRDEEISSVLSLLMDKHILLVIEKDSQLVAMTGAIVAPHLYMPTKLVLTECFLWIEEKYRSQGYGEDLVEELEETARDLGCTYVAMCSTIHTPQFKAYLVSEDYREVETSYLKEI